VSFSQIGETWAGYVRARCDTAISVLKKHEFDARFFTTAPEAVQAVLEVIPVDAEVGTGGSWTLRQIGAYEALKGRGNEVYVHDPEMSFEESLQVRRKALASPFYLSSSNAITLKGEIVNVDGMGNRVAGLSFGPSTAIVIAGYNKLVPDLEAALQRIREVAAPANAARYNLDTPCVKKGQCQDCSNPARICRITTIISRRPILTDFKVFLVGESLGF
jgi:LUD domain